MTKPKCQRCSGKEVIQMRVEGIQAPVCLKCAQGWDALRDKELRVLWEKFLKGDRS